MKVFNRKETKERRRELRKGQTDAERQLWNQLRNKQMRGYKFFRQYGIGLYVADFYCPLSKLAIEVDGGQHYSEEGKIHDERRAEFLEGLGIRTIRFDNLDVLKNLKGVLESILNELPPAPSLLKRGRGGVGFTLIEMFLGLSIFSIIALCLFGVFRGAMQIKQRSEDQNTILREARWVFLRMDQDLNNMAHYDFSGSTPQMRACAGARDKISFLKLSDEGLSVVSFYLAPPEKIFVHKTLIGVKHRGNRRVVATGQESPPSIVLVREEKPLIDDWQGKESSLEDQEILSANIKKDGLAFFYAQTQKEIGWKDLWDQNDLPSGVRIRLSFQTEDSQKVLEFFKDVFIPSGGSDYAPP